MNWPGSQFEMRKLRTPASVRATKWLTTRLRRRSWPAGPTDERPDGNCRRSNSSASRVGMLHLLYLRLVRPIERVITDQEPVRAFRQGTLR
jgi:hypothetical protein